MNKQYLIIAAVALIIIFFVMRMKKKKDENVREDINEIDNIPDEDAGKIGELNLNQQIGVALGKIIREFGVDIARKVEQIYRLETAHFKSRGFLSGFSPGMEKHKPTFPFGWTSMVDFWNELNFVPEIQPLKENKTGKVKEFLKFPNVEIPMRGLAIYVKKYGPERWYSLNPIAQSRYRDSLNSIKPKIVDLIWSKK